MKKDKKKKPEQTYGKEQKPKAQKLIPLPVSHFIIVAIATVGFLFPVVKNGFINFDDPQYLLENPLIQKMDKETMKIWFSEQILGNYQPLVLFSYAMQYKFFGIGSATGYHAFSLIMHLLNSLLVLIIANRLLKNHTGALVTALLFAIHPLHVESVAWVAAQKDTFYVFFFLLSVLYYMRFRAESKKLFIVLCFIAFILALLSKAQAVVLPVVLLLIDFLERRPKFGMEIVYKIPFFALSLLFGIIAIKMQSTAGAVQDAVFSQGERILFACFGFMNYLWQTLVPLDLAIFYPYPEANLIINSKWVYVAPFIVILATIAAFYFGKKDRMILFGYLFFCVNIALVIQLIPVGDAVHADRYTYISLIGFFLIAGHLIGGWYDRSPGKRNLIYGLCGAYFLGIGALSFLYSKKWSDSITIYTHALERYPAPIVYANRAAAYFKAGQLEEALVDFTDCIKIKPQFPNAYKNRALTYESMQKHNEAIADFAEALKYEKKDLVGIYFTRGNIYKNANMVNEAFNDFNMIIQLNPNVVDAWQARAECYFKMGKREEALADLNKAISMKSDYGAAYFNRSITLRDMGRVREALDDALAARKYGQKVEDKYIQELQSMLK